MGKKLKRAFTITELVIVIAVIAILAAVLIPTFTSLINRANESADMQAVKNMNTALMNEELLTGEKPRNLTEVHAILSEAGYDSDGYHPISKGYAFYWDADLNCILLVDAESKVVYPEEYVNSGDDYADNDTRRYNLENGFTEADNALLDVVSAGGTLSVGTEAEQVDIADIFRISAHSGETFAGATIRLATDIGLAEGQVQTVLSEPLKEFKGTLDGNNKTITGFTIQPKHGKDGNGYLYSDMYDVELGVQKSKYGVGIIDYLGEGGVVKNLNVVYNDPVQPADPGNRYTYFGGIVGFLNGGTIENCTVSGSIYQYNRVGGIVGTALAGTIKDCTVTANITSYCFTEANYAYSYAGGIVAYVGNVEKATNDVLNITGCTVGSVSGAISITANSYVAGGIVGWKAAGTEVTVSGCDLQNVNVVSVNVNGNGSWGVGLVFGLIGGTGDVAISDILVGENISVKKNNQEIQDGDLMQDDVCLLEIIAADFGTLTYDGKVINP